MATEASQHAEWSDEQRHLWSRVLAAGVAAQQIVSGAVAVGGTAAALYAHHRLSLDTDHLLPSLRDSFPEVLQILEGSPQWRTARVQPPVLILGSINGVQVGFRQARHSGQIESIVMQTSEGLLRVPTLDEMIGMKAYLAYARNSVRDYLDFAALASCASPAEVVVALLKSDERYGPLQVTSVGLSIAKRLSDPQPYDLESIRLEEYKGLAPQWQSWERVDERCRVFGGLLGERLVTKRDAP